MSTKTSSLNGCVPENHANLREWLENNYDELMFADGFDEAIVGVVERCGSPPVVCYDVTRCIDVLAKQMTYEEAVEYFDFNVAGAYMGPLTPMYLTRIELQ
jgi:hypothetical protein